MQQVDFMTCNLEFEIHHVNIAGSTPWNFHQILYQVILKLSQTFVKLFYIEIHDS